MRRAITNANTFPGSHTITFNIPASDEGYVTDDGNNYYWLIQPASALPAITKNGTVIDGTTQTTNEGDTNTLGPEVMLDGMSAGVVDGLDINANYCTIEGLVVRRFNGDGIVLNGSDDEVLWNYLGTDATGEVGLSNGYYDGIAIYGSGNQVGDGTAAGRNVISGNGSGVYVSGDGNEVMGNYIGTGAGGTVALGNEYDGVDIYGGSGNQIGDGTAGGRNVISGNYGEGVVIADGSNNEVRGNYLGCQADGVSPLGNGDNGIYIFMDSSASVNNLIGPNNTIANNAVFGILIDNSQSTNNTITQNSIHDNTDLGIGLMDGANEGISPPVIEAASVNLVTGEATANATVEVFSTGVPDAGGSGEGRTYLGSTTADGSGNWTINLTLTGGTTLTATATDTNGNTSMFSLNASVEGGGGGTFEVINTNDSGTGSLRQAILNANAISGSHTITFNIPTAEAGFTTEAGVSFWKIKPTSALPSMTRDATVIDGRTQTSNRGNTNTLGPEVMLDGTAEGASINGLTINANYCTVEGLVIGNFNNSAAYGVYISAGSSNEVKGNYIGTDPSGTLPRPNTDGVFIYNGAKNNLIGGGASGEGNVISGNYYGIYMGTNCNSNKVKGNYFGTNALGNAALPNSQYAVFVESAAYNMIGGVKTGEGNVICANSYGGIWFRTSCVSNEVLGNYIGCNAAGTSLGSGGYGVWLSDAGTNYNLIGDGSVGGRNIISGNYYGVYISNSSTSNEVLGNYIGTNPAGTAALANTGYGVFIQSSSYNWIGDGTAGGRNVISGNGGDGINLNDASSNEVMGDYVGCQADGVGVLANAGNGIYITRTSLSSVKNLIGPNNIIANNTAAGVQIGSSQEARNTVTQNSLYNNTDLGILLTGGANGGLNPPVINMVSKFTGLVIGTATASATVEVFSTGTPDPSGGGEGRAYLGSTIANGSGAWTMTLGALADGTILTATATDTNGNTSQFSVNRGLAVPSTTILF